MRIGYHSPWSISTPSLNYLYTFTPSEDIMGPRNSTRGSAIAERPRDALYQLKSCHLLRNYTTIKNLIWKACEYKITQGHRKWPYSIGRISIYLFLLVICSNNVSVTVSEILPLLQRTWLPVILRSPPISVSIRRLKLQVRGHVRFPIRI